MKRSLPWVALVLCPFALLALAINDPGISEYFASHAQASPLAEFMLKYWWFLLVAADAKLTHCAEVKVTHLGEDDGLFGAVDVDPGGSSGDTSDGPKGRRSQIHRQAAQLLAQHGAAVFA